jgi:hypothetical protein
MELTMQPPKATQPRSPMFVAHGQVSFVREGQRLIGSAAGPFNLELAQQVRQHVPAICRELAGNGAFDYLCEFHHSALATPEALQDLAETGAAVGRRACPGAQRLCVPARFGGRQLAGADVRAGLCGGPDDLAHLRQPCRGTALVGRAGALNLRGQMATPCASAALS